MKSNTEIFCEKVAHSTLEVSPDNLKGFDIAVIIQLIATLAPIVIGLIQNCPNNKEAIKTTIKNPTFLQKARLRAEVRSTLRNSGYARFRYLGDKAADAFLKEKESLTDKEIDALIEESEVDNWLI